MRRRPDWPLRLALVALVVVWPLGLWLGATVSLGATPKPPKAHAAFTYTGTAGANCETIFTPAHATADGNSAAYQVELSRVEAKWQCGLTVEPMTALADSIGILPADGSWASQPLTVGASARSTAEGVEDVRQRLGACASSCSAAPASIYAQLDRLRLAWGAWRVGSEDYDPHTALWLLDRIDRNGDTEIDRLGVIGDKLDTVHTDLQAIASSSTPAASSSEPGGLQTVSLSTGDRDLATGNQAEVVSVLWVLVGCLAALIPAHFMMRELLG